MISNIFGSPRTTLAGLWAVIAPQLIPQIVAYFGQQPGAGWQVVGAIVGIVVPLLMADAKKPAVVSLPPGK